MNPTIPPQPPPLEAELPEKLDLRILIEALLRRPRDLVLRLANPGHQASVRFLSIAILSFLLYGLVLGCFAKHEQLWIAPLKVTSGILLSALICFPSLYIFSTLAGAKISVAQLCACFCGTLALAGLLLLGFAPALWIFAESTGSFGFMGFLGITVWLVSVFFGIRILKTAVLCTGGNQKGPLIVWSMIFILVTLQMSTSLRPIIGRSDQFLTQEKKFFIQHWSDWASESQSPSTSDTSKTSSWSSHSQDTPSTTPASEKPQNFSRQENPFRD